MQTTKTKQKENKTHTHTHTHTRNAVGDAKQIVEQLKQEAAQREKEKSFPPSVLAELKDIVSRYDTMEGAISHLETRLGGLGSMAGEVARDMMTTLV